MTELEPEFDVNERDNWYAMTEYDDALCPQCHQLRSVCEDPTTVYTPQMHVCYASVAQAVYTRVWHKRYEKTDPDKDGWLPTDGVLVWAADDLPTDERFIDDSNVLAAAVGDAANQ